MSTISQFYSEGKLIEEMRCVFKDEDTSVDFHVLLEKARNFTNLNMKDRNTLLVDIVFYKGELEAMKVKTEAIIHKMDAIVYNECFEELKQKGLRYTEELLKTMCLSKDIESTNSKYKLFLEQFRVCDKWTKVLTDLYYILNSENKILSSNEVV